MRETELDGQDYVFHKHVDDMQIFKEFEQTN